MKKFQPADFNKLFNKQFEREAKVMPCHSNRASQLGAPCERQLVYMRTHWESRLLPEIRLLQIFKEGREQERMVSRHFMDMGFTIEEAQRPITDNLFKQYQITGHPEGRLCKDDWKQLFEIKSASQNYFDTLHSINDYMRYTWGKKYYAQCQIYMLGFNVTTIWMFVKCKGRFEIRALDEIELDYDYVESLLKKAERINTHITNGTLPDKYTGDYKECKDCDFNHICLPDMDGGLGIEFLNKKEMEESLKIRESLREQGLAYSNIDRKIKDELKALKIKNDQFVVGSFLITQKRSKRKGYNVPDTIKNKYKIETDSISFVIEKV